MYCTIHQKNCFAGISLSSSCRRGNRTEFDFEASESADDDGDDEDDDEDVREIKDNKQEEKSGMVIADLFVPSHITKHRIARGGRGPIQLQFMVEWHPGWTSDRSLARSVIRKHPSEDLFFVKYRSSWEPYTDYYDTVTPEMVREYKSRNDIEDFGSGLDKNVLALSKKERRSLKAEDLYPNYHFEYCEEPSDDHTDDSSDGDGELIPPPLRKRRGRPTKDKPPKQRRVLTEQNPDCGCSRACRNNFDAAYRKKIKVEYDRLADFATRSTWLTHIAELTPCPYRGPALQLRAKRRPKQYTAKYFFVKKGLRVRVCKAFFQTVLQLGNTALANLNQHSYKNRGSQLVQRVDLRGKHIPKHAASGDDVYHLQRHIFKFPREPSHYTLGKKESLHPSLDVKKMHELYKKQEVENARRVLSYGVYLKEFNKYGLKFQPYRTDTCSTCDKLREQLKVDPQNENLKAQKASHLREADMGYRMQDQDGRSVGRTLAIWGDMQSVNQIPKLPTGAAFYKRSYKVYNEDFYLASSGQHSMYMWGQLDGKKGANDVISCLHKFLGTITDQCKHLILWFDGTSSQLKNTTTLLYLLQLTDSKSPLYKFERISLKYQVPGHTYMACDRAFGTMSNLIKRRETIGDPLELVDIANECKNCSAEWLPRDQHIDWKEYLAQIYHTTDGSFMKIDEEPLLMKSRWFSFGFSQIEDGLSGNSILVQHYPNEIRARLSFDGKAVWKSYRVEQTKSRGVVAFENFPAYRSQLLLENERIKDLQIQKQWLPSKYKNLEIYNLEERKGGSEDKQGSKS
jgi:hypothetical protein